jgi:hypothetical protein
LCQPNQRRNQSGTSESLGRDEKATT